MTTQELTQLRDLLTQFQQEEHDAIVDATLAPVWDLLDTLEVI